MTPAASCSPTLLLFPLLDCLCAAIVQLEAIKNVDKIISNSIYILKDNLPFTGTNNIINSINPCPPCHLAVCVVLPFIDVVAAFGICPAAQLVVSSPFFSLSLPRIAGAFTICQQLKFSKHFWICLPGYTLAALSVSALLLSEEAGAEGFRFHGCPQRAHFAFASNIHRLPWLLLLLLLSLSLHLAPVEVPAWHPLFWFLSTAWICKLPGLNRAWPGLPWWQQGEPLHHKLQLCWPNSRSSASLPQNLFGQMFFSVFFWPIKHAAAPHSPSTDDTIFGMRPGAVPDTDTGIMCWPR